MLSDLKRTNARVCMDWLFLQHAQMPESRDIAILVVTDRQQTDNFTLLFTLSLVHVHRVINNAGRG